MSDYHINIFYSDEDGGYIAEIAKSVWLEAARSSGKPVPHPRYRPAIYQTR